jgi:hypothetical protein
LNITPKKEEKIKIKGNRKENDKKWWTKVERSGTVLINKWERYHHVNIEKG